MKKFSIICIFPNLNGEKYMEKTIKSFLNQPIKNKKMIIVDGKSTDKSFEIIKKYKKNRSNIYWIKYKDKGLYDAHNKGLKFLKFDKNEIYCNIGNDDIYKKNIYADVINNFEKYPKIGALYYDHEIKIKNKNKIQKKYSKCIKKNINILNLKIFGNIAAGHNVFIKTKYLKKFKFCTKLKYSGDYYSYLHLVKNKNCKFKYIPKAANLSYAGENISTKYIYEGALEALKVYYRTFSIDMIFFYRIILVIKTRFTTLLKNFLRE